MSTTSQVNEQSPKYSIMLHEKQHSYGDKNILFIAFLNKKHKLFKHEQQETHLDTKNEKTNTLSWIFRVLQNVVY